MRRFRKWLPYIIGSVLFGLSLYILYRGFLIAGENGWGRSSFLAGLPAKVEEMAADTYNGVLTWETETEVGGKSEKSLARRIVDRLFPPVPSEEQGTEAEGEAETGGESETKREVETKKEAESKEDPETEVQQAQENNKNEKRRAVEETKVKDEEISENQKTGTKKDQQDKDMSDGEIRTGEAVTAFSNSAIPISPAGSMRQAPQTLPWVSMEDFDFLLNNYFILDMSTAVDEELLNLEDLMGKDLRIDTGVEGPQILIYHTHSQEAFIDSRPGDMRDTIMGVGERLKEILEGQYDFSVLHHTKIYDMIDGELDRNKAYNLAAPDIEEILAAYPSIQLVIDLHRDGVEDYKFVTEFNGKPTAMIMFYNGLSRTALNGAVEYLPNPYIADNLALSFQLQMKAAEYYPGFTRNIYLQSLRYNQHLCPRSLLIESGTQLNTVEEEYNAMEPLADILNQVLRGE